MKQRLIHLLIIFMIIVWAIPSYSQWSTNPNVNNPISTIRNTESEPMIVNDGSGGAIIMWYKEQSETEFYIYTQRLDSIGVIRWVSDGIYIGTASGRNTGNPEIISDGAEGAIITWYFESGTGTGIFAQRINSSGVIQWTPGGVLITTASGYQANPSIASDGAGGAIITWQDTRNYLSDIYAQRISTNGIVQWAIVGVPISTANSGQNNPRIISDGSGGAIITWYDERHETTSPDIYAQRINSSGFIQWASDGVPVSIVNDIQWFPEIVSDGNGGAIIVWEDRRSGTSLDIYAQRISGEGIEQWTTNGETISTADLEQRVPEITSDGFGGAIITWYDERHETTSPDIYAQRINSSGVVQWTIDGVPISTGVDNENNPTILNDGNGGAIITWHFESGTGTDIFAQRINSDGALQWTPNGVAISTASNDQLIPAIASDGAGGAIIVWEDLRSGVDTDIYVQLVQNDGTLGKNNTLAGSMIVVQTVEPTTGYVPAILTFSSVTVAGQTTLVTDTLGILPPSGFQFGNPPIYYDITTTATYEGPVHVCIKYTDSSFWSESNIHLFHFESNNWVDITSNVDTSSNILCGSVTTLSPFAVFETNASRIISGRVKVGNNGLENVIVKLLDQDGNPLQDFLPITTNISGEYAFAEVPGAQEYQVLIVEPLGYTVDQNPKAITLPSRENILLDFILTQAVVANNARGVGYWKHQFDVYVTNKGNAQETQQSLTSYIASVHEHYTPHFNLFSDLTTLEQWQDVLTMGNGAPMYERARSHVATLVFNLASMKIGQYTTVTTDGKTAGDVLTYSSILLTDTEPSNDQLAKNLAEKVNNHAQIASGIVPSGSVLYKGSWAENVNQTFDASHDFALYDNYPNPFNPVTNFRFKIPHKSFVKLEIFNSLGQQLSTIINEEKEAGNYEVSWNASGLTSGVYFYKLTSGSFSETKKLILLK